MVVIKRGKIYGMFYVALKMLGLFEWLGWPLSTAGGCSPTP